MIRCTEGAVRLGFDRLKKRMGTYEFASVFEYILTDRARNSEIRSHWKLVCVEYNVPAFIIVALCRADRRWAGTGTHHASDGSPKRNQR